MNELELYSDEDIMDEFYGRELDRFKSDVVELDYVDKEQFGFIAETFIAANWEQREKIYNLIKTTVK